MQDQLDVEEESRRLLPELLSELFATSIDDVTVDAPNVDRAFDLIAQVGQRSFALEVKSSGRPGLIDAAERQIARRDSQGALTALVVPYMTPAGARAAADRQLNWLDLSGNASIRGRSLYVRVEGRPNKFVTPGPTGSPFAPRGSRIAHRMLLDPKRWWRQVELSDELKLDNGYVSRVVHRLEDERLIERQGKQLRPRDPDLLLDAWADDYRLDRHKQVFGHATGSGIELARGLSVRLQDHEIDHAFTGLVSAWASNGHARFRLNTIYVSGSPRAAAEAMGVRLNERGANVQILSPNDSGVFIGRREQQMLPCVSPIQTYLDLLQLPERAEDAAEQLRADRLLWPNDH
jgi:hypothetical protein